MNPFQPLYDGCNTGDSAGKYADLPDFPRLIDVELTSSCNFRCLMCPTGNLSLKRPAEFMERDTYRRIVAQCEEHGTALRFIGWGEPTLHPGLVRYIWLASDYDILTHLNTNGSKITSDMARKLVQAGLSSIKFSFQGVDRQSYREMRNTDFWHGMIQAITTMRETRGHLDSQTPWIAASTTTTYEPEDKIADFRRQIEPLVDQLTIGKTIFDFMDLAAVRLRPDDVAMLERLKALSSGDGKAHPSPCPEVFDKLSIHADGSVVLCCNDFDGTVMLGNVNDAPIAALWRHPKIEAYRERLAKNDYDAPLCRDCYDYQGLSQAAE